MARSELHKLEEVKFRRKYSLFRSQEGAKFFLAGNPWSCNCHNIKTFQEFLLKYNDIIMDAEKMRCQEYPGEALEQVDYKTICSSKDYSLLVFCSLELLLLVAVIVKLTCDCVEYKRTGNLPWCARWVGRVFGVDSSWFDCLRKLCWSVPGIPRPHWTSPQLPTNFCNTRSSDSRGSVGQGSSGYLTSRYWLITQSIYPVCVWRQIGWDWNSAFLPFGSSVESQPTILRHAKAPCAVCTAVHCYKK